MTNLVVVVLVVVWAAALAPPVLRRLVDARDGWLDRTALPMPAPRRHLANVAPIPRPYDWNNE